MVASAGWSSGNGGAGAGARAMVAGSCDSGPVTDFDSDADGVFVTMPMTGRSGDTASAAAHVSHLIDNTCLGSDHTTSSANASVELATSLLYGEYATAGASAFEIGNSPWFTGVFAVENAHPGADFALHGVVGGAGTLYLFGTLHHDLEIRFCPNSSSPYPSITTVHIVSTFLRVTGQGGTPLLTRRGAGFMTERSDFDLFNGPYPAPAKGFGDFADLTTWDGSVNAQVYLPIDEEFSVAANDHIDAQAWIRSKSYTVDDHSQIADVDDNGTIDPIADRDAFTMGSAYGDEGYSPFVDFDQDGDNDLADYAALDALVELNTGCRVDYDGDAYAGNNDEAIFVGFWFNQNPSADLGSAAAVHAPDGQFDNNDFIAFYDYFFSSPCTP